VRLKPLGPIELRCPDCGTPVPTVVNVSLVEVVVVGDGVREKLEFVPDLTDVYAHAWTHDLEA
jgi:adenine-specific DNA methylase